MIELRQVLRRAPGSFSRWLWPRAALADARARRDQVKAATLRDLAAARMARRLAARAALPVDDPVGGRRIVAELLYREATLRSLCAIMGCETPRALAATLAGLSVDEVASRTGGSQSAVAVQQLFGDEHSRQQFGASVRASAYEGSPMAEVAVPLHDLAESLVKRAGRHVHASGRLLVEITLRWLLVVAGAAALVALSPVSRLWNRENILVTAAWRLSSANPHESEATGTLPAPAGRPFFFHTAEEDGPWVELEIPGPPGTLSRIVVDNRKDCCEFRAIPLVAEISTDQRSWTEVARRTAAFKVWTANFPPQTARWLRLRVLRSTQLHLENVSAYR